MVLPGEYVKHTPLLELFEECHDDEWASRDHSLPISDGKLMSTDRVNPSGHKAYAALMPFANTGARLEHLQLTPPSQYPSKKCRGYGR